MARLYLLSILLLENLAEHLILELAVRISDPVEIWKWDMSMWLDDEVKSMEGGIVILVDAAGESTSEEDVSSKYLPELLQVLFAVGTEHTKTWKQHIKLCPKPSELGPITVMEFMPTTRRERTAMHRNTK